jgi:short-subunit dehydrogenase
VTSVNPGFAETEAFPQQHVPKALVMRADRVARAIVEVVKKGKAPEVSVPRALGPWQAFRILTPPLYRWGMRTVAGRMGSTRAR